MWCKFNQRNKLLVERETLASFAFATKAGNESNYEQDWTQARLTFIRRRTHTCTTQSIRVKFSLANEKGN